MVSPAAARNAASASSSVTYPALARSNARNAGVGAAPARVIRIALVRLRLEPLRHVPLEGLARDALLYFAAFARAEDVRHLESGRDRAHQPRERAREPVAVQGVLGGVRLERSRDALDGVFGGYRYRGSRTVARSGERGVGGHRAAGIATRVLTEVSLDPRGDARAARSALPLDGRVFERKRGHTAVMAGLSGAESRDSCARHVLGRHATRRQGEVISRWTRWWRPSRLARPTRMSR